MKEIYVVAVIATRNTLLAFALISSAIGAGVFLSESAAAEGKDSSGAGASDSCTTFLKGCLDDCAGLPPASYVGCHAQCVTRADSCGRSPASTKQSPVPVAKPPVKAQ
jgi:hypothetical protein